MMDASDLFTLARTVYGEARGESDQGRAAVAHVVLNRFRSDKWFSAGTIEAVCRKPFQFSCWNKVDPNRCQIENANLDDSTFLRCFDVAVGALSGRLPDPTAGSTHYHAARAQPKWAARKSPVGTVGRHVFYNDID